MKAILPLVSIIIPTYNYSNYIIEAINSVLDQSYPTDKIEIIIVDDGSTDNTEDVLQPQINSGQIKYYRQANNGKASATRKGIELATGKYMFNLDADDLFLPNKIKQTVAIFEGDNSIVHVASPAKIWEVDKNEYRVEDIPSKLYHKKLIGEEVLSFFYENHILYGGGSTFAARSNILKSLAIPDGVNMYIDEYLVIAALNKGNSYFIEEPLSIWRVHSNNYSVNKDPDKLKKKQKTLLQNSALILQTIEKGDYSLFMKKAYLLQHETRVIFFKEEWGVKTLSDILSFASLIWKQQFSLQHLKNYSFFTRLIPLGMQKILRRLK